jgi:hypothetical protein
MAPADELFTKYSLALKLALSCRVINGGQSTSELFPEGEISRAEKKVDNGTRG